MLCMESVSTCLTPQGRELLEREVLKQEFNSPLKACLKGFAEPPHGTWEGMVGADSKLGNDTMVTIEEHRSLQILSVNPVYHRSTSAPERAEHRVLLAKGQVFLCREIHQRIVGPIRAREGEINLRPFYVRAQLLVDVVPGLGRW